MCQPKQPPSPADRQKEALDDIERIAHAAYDAFLTLVTAGRPAKWEEVDDTTRSCYRVMVRRLLDGDVIKVGKRPNVERPLKGQTTIDDQLDAIELRAQGR